MEVPVTTSKSIFSSLAAARLRSHRRRGNLPRPAPDPGSAWISPFLSLILFEYRRLSLSICVEGSGNAQVFLQCDPLGHDGLGCFLPYIPDMPGLIHIAGDVLAVFRIPDNEPVFRAVFIQPDARLGGSKGTVQTGYIKAQSGLVLRLSGRRRVPDCQLRRPCAHSG